MRDNHAPELYQLLAAKAIAFISTGVYDAAKTYACVDFDNRTAAMRVTQCLVEPGHRRIAMIAGITVNNDRASMRAEGFRAFLAANGLKLPPYWLIERPYDINEGRLALALRVLMGQDLRPNGYVFYTVPGSVRYCRIVSPGRTRLN